MFKKLLIANRGEIAVRIIRACRDLDIASVAVYSDIDGLAPHTRLADEAYNIGPAPAAESYLDVSKILEAARRSGAEAVHPGYGFLAENGGFAQAVIDMGLTWVGPAPGVIDAMGDKTAARRAATDAGVATVPGTARRVTSAAEVAAFIDDHGLPLAIKASAGGGGKGFRVVTGETDIEDALQGAAREAQAYFSSPDVYLEKYLAKPRHIEIQVLGDAAGKILSFPERDCSVQRRHQKLIEESPSPVLDESVRAAIMEAAARVSAQVGYQNAGTCEFLLDEDLETFYFLEMNTRLQVEHPVTEFVTNIDLVRAQMLVAAGEDLDFDQDSITLRGAAIECRINAENPAKKFMPAPGHIGNYREPGGPGVRVDSGVEADYVVPQAYDPLIAKLITYGATRDEARRRMLRALGEFEVAGIDTTIPFHKLMLSDARFASADYNTGTVERELDLSPLSDLQAPRAVPGEREVVERQFEVEISGKLLQVTARERLATTAKRRKPKAPDKVAGAVHGGSETLTAPMQGTIIKVLVEQGQEVEAGDAIVVLEAMKMENSILAHTAGTVEELKVSRGQSIEAGGTIALIR